MHWFGLFVEFIDSNDDNKDDNNITEMDEDKIFRKFYDL